MAGELKFLPETAAPTGTPPPEAVLEQIESLVDRLFAPDPPPPWHVRHARKLITGAVLLVAASLAFFALYARWSYKEPRIEPALAPAPLPVTALPESPPVPTAVAPLPKPAPSVPKATVTRASPPIAPAAPAITGPRPPAVTHTQREPAPAGVAAAAPAAAAPAAPVVAAPPAASGACPDTVAALGLCASQMRKEAK